MGEIGRKDEGHVSPPLGGSLTPTSTCGLGRGYQMRKVAMGEAKSGMDHGLPADSEYASGFG